MPAPALRAALLVSAIAGGAVATAGCAGRGAWVEQAEPRERLVPATPTAAPAVLARLEGPVALSTQVYAGVETTLRVHGYDASGGAVGGVSLTLTAAPAGASLPQASALADSGIADVVAVFPAPGQYTVSAVAAGAAGATVTASQAVVVGSNVLELAGAAAVSCVARADGQVFCWGQDADLLGLGGAESVGAAPGQMGPALAAVRLGAGERARGVAVGAGGSCALLASGGVKCWGGHDGSGNFASLAASGRGGDAATMGDSLPPVPLPSGRTATAVRAGNQAACALLDSGELACWGNKGLGAVGLCSQDLVPVVPLGAGRTVKDASVGDSTSCAVLDNGMLKCWGHGRPDVLGNGFLGAIAGCAPATMGDNLQPVDLGTGKLAVQVSSGLHFTCVLLDDASIKCWGVNQAGALGLGDTQTRGDAPGQMGDTLPAVDLGSAAAPVAVSAGTAHACAILADGNMRCWGDNTYGELGLGDTVTRGSAPGQMGDALPPVLLPPGTRALAVRAAANRTCVSLSDDTVRCWGQGGTLGLGDTVARGGSRETMGAMLPPVALPAVAGPSTP